MRRDIVRQFVPEGQWEKLTEVERQRIMAEVNQRMLGIAQGIQLGAAEAQKRVAEAQRAADAKAQAAAAAVKATPQPPPCAPRLPSLRFVRLPRGERRRSRARGSTSPSSATARWCAPRTPKSTCRTCSPRC